MLPMSLITVVESSNSGGQSVAPRIDKSGTEGSRSPWLAIYQQPHPENNELDLARLSLDVRITLIAVTTMPMAINYGAWHLGAHKMVTAL